jgi:hypothetical protein
MCCLSESGPSCVCVVVVAAHASHLMILAVLQGLLSQAGRAEGDEKNRPRPDWHQNTQHSTGAAALDVFSLFSLVAEKI